MKAVKLTLLFALFTVYLSRSLCSPVLPHRSLTAGNIQDSTVTKIKTHRLRTGNVNYVYHPKYQESVSDNYVKSSVTSFRVNPEEIGDSTIANFDDAPPLDTNEKRKPEFDTGANEDEENEDGLIKMLGSRYAHSRENEQEVYPKDYDSEDNYPDNSDFGKLKNGKDQADLGNILDDDSERIIASPISINSNYKSGKSKSLLQVDPAVEVESVEKITSRKSDLPDIAERQEEEIEESTGESSENEPKKRTPRRGARRERRNPRV